MYSFSGHALLHCLANATLAGNSSCRLLLVYATTPFNLCTKALVDRIEPLFGYSPDVSNAIPATGPVARRLAQLRAPHTAVNCWLYIFLRDSCAKTASQARDATGTCTNGAVSGEDRSTGTGRSAVYSTQMVCMFRGTVAHPHLHSVPQAVTNVQAVLRRSMPAG